MRPAAPSAADAAPYVAPRRSRLVGPWVWRAVAGVAVVLYLVRLAYFVFHDLADGMAWTMLGHRLFAETTGALTSVPVLVLLVLAARRAPLAWLPWKQGAAIYIGVFAVLSAAHTFAMLVLRAATAPFFGFDGYALHLQPSRFAYEAANDVLPFAAMIAGLALAEIFLERRERERRAAALERSLLEAELRNLRLQLQPHFLFNALNTISSVMYEDVAEADALLGQLAELLRTSLRTTHAHEVTVREELALLTQYLGLMHARFGDRLTVSVDAEDAVADCLVPSMVLQPLVENAVRHGAVAHGRPGRVRITIQRRPADDAGHADLELCVLDDGPGLTDERELLRAGTGLTATAQRLQLLYGDAHAFSAANAPGGGFAVTLRIPLRKAGSIPAIPVATGALA